MSHGDLGFLLSVNAAKRRMSRADQDVVSKAISTRSHQLEKELVKFAQVELDEWRERIIEAAHKILGQKGEAKMSGERYIRCIACGLKSFNENDIDQKCCGHCDQFHESEADYELGTKEPMRHPTHTYTLAMLEVLPSTHEDIRKRLEAAGYHHAIDPENGHIDMTGIGLLPMREPEATTLTVEIGKLEPEQIERIQKFVDSQLNGPPAYANLMVEANDGDVIDAAIDAVQAPDAKP